MNNSQLKAMAADPAAFQAALVIDTADGKRPFGEVMADFQRERFTAINPALVAVARGQKPDIGRFWWEATKGCSKDSDLAVCLLWLVAFSARLLTIQVGAADQDQADELRKAAKTWLHNNPWLGELVEIQSMAIVSLRPGGGPRVDIIAADAPGSHGSRPHVLVVNEACHHKSQEFAATLLDNASKVPSGIVVIATNAGHLGSWQEQWRNIALEDPSRWSVHIYAKPAPWLSDKELAEARKRNPPHRYARLFEGIWGSGEASAFDHDVIEAAITRKGPEHKPRDGWQYFLGADLSARRDWTACCIVGKRVGAQRLIQKPRKDREVLPRALQAMAELGMEGAPPLRPQFDEVVQSIKGDGLMRLIDLRLWKPRPGADINLREVGAYILRMHERFGFAQVNIDQWQAVLLRQLLAEADVPVNTVAFTSNSCCDMAATALAAFGDGRVRLYRHEQLISDLKRCKMKDTPLGIRLEFKRGKDGHGDSATAFFLALLAAKDHNESLGDEFYDGQLIY